MRQRMKLTSTNRSIGLIVPIAHAHQTSLMMLSNVLTRQRRCGRRAGYRRLGSAGCCNYPDKTQRRVQIKKRLCLTSFSIRFAPFGRKSCALPTWWFWRGGCTRSHSEHGRETPQRRWYFVLRRGRVGRCQVCKAQENPENKDHLLFMPRPSRNTGRPQAALLFC